MGAGLGKGKDSAYTCGFVYLRIYGEPEGAGALFRMMMGVEIKNLGRFGYRNEYP
jgi:hypothetical protein